MNKTLTVLVCIMVAGVVVGASLPIFDSLTASSESVHNDGAGWVRFALDRNAGTEYTVTISEDENGVYVTNGSDVQTYDDSSTADFETILYADSNLSVWCDSAACHVMGVKDGVPQYYEGMDAVTIVRDADGVTVTPGSNEPLQFDVPTWAYIPVSNGNYGFFAYDEERGVQNYPSDMPLAVVGGGNVGVYAYNDIYRYNGLGLRMNPIYDDDGLFYGASWSKPAPVEEPSDPDSITLDPIVFDPSIIDIDDPFNPEPDASIMAVPTPSYVDGDWGYNNWNAGARIVAYMGTGGDIVVPATVGGREVLYIGNGNNPIIDDSISDNSTLTLSEGLTTISSNAFNHCTKLTGTLTFPSTMTYIGDNAFYYCSGFTNLVLPDLPIRYGTSVFYACSGLTGTIVIPDSMTTIPPGMFTNCTNIEGVVIPPTVTTIGGSFSNCANLSGTIVIPDGVSSLEYYTFYGCTSLDTLVIPESVTSIANQFAERNGLKRLIISSDAVPGNNAFKQIAPAGGTEVLDLSEDVDYSVNNYGLRNSVVYTTIGDCFGSIGTVDYQSSGGGSPTQVLIGIIPLIMVLGLVLVAVGMFIWNRM